MTELFDIFSMKKEKKKNKERKKIIVDHRERNCPLITELMDAGFEIDFRNLKVADYIINDIAIERKTVSDFVSSMINNRLINQLKEIKQYEKPLLIIEGVDEQELYSDENSEGVHANSIRGFLLSILIHHKIPIIFTKDYKDTSKFISLLSKKKSKELPLNVKKKTLDKKEQLQFIIESFPGIGPKTSRKLLEKFKTIQNIANASEEELGEILGKKAKIIKDILERIY